MTTPAQWHPDSPTSDTAGEATVVAPDWPEERVVLTPPGGTILAEHFTEGCVQLHHERACELRAVGFSPTGRALVVASSCEVNLFTRQS